MIATLQTLLIKAERDCCPSLRPCLYCPSALNKSLTDVLKAQKKKIEEVCAYFYNQA